MFDAITDLTSSTDLCTEEIEEERAGAALNTGAPLPLADGPALAGLAGAGEDAGIGLLARAAPLPPLPPPPNPPPLAEGAERGTACPPDVGAIDMEEEGLDAVVVVTTGVVVGAASAAGLGGGALSFFFSIFFFFRALDGAAEARESVGDIGGDMALETDLDLDSSIAHPPLSSSSPPKRPPMSASASSSPHASSFFSSFLA